MTTAVTVPDPDTDPISAWKYLRARRDVNEAEARMPSLYRLWDKQMRYIGTVAAHRSIDAGLMLHDTKTGEVVLRASDWLVKFLRTDVRAEEDLNFTIDPYPHRRNWRTRMGFKVTNVKPIRNENGVPTVTLELAENREHWKHILFGATPFMPPEAQPIKCWLTPGNTRTIVTLGGIVNLARLFNPAMAMVGNLLNPGAWIGAANPLNWNPLNWPLQMQFVNPLFDQSRLSVLMSRWQNAHIVTESMLKDAGCNVRPYIWLEEDEDSPHPELAALIGEQLARPTRNCIVFAVEDNSGVTGVTGLADGGVINLIAATGDDLITNTLYPEYQGDNGIYYPQQTAPLIRKWFGAAPSIPDVLFREAGIVSSEHSMFKAKAKHIMTGGRSPQWLNQVQTFLIRYAISKIAEAVAFVGQIPGTEGLENVYQGQADDMLFAFMRYTDPNRELRSGEYGLLEEFVQGSGSAYTISSPLTLREGHFKTRPYHAFKVTARNAMPHRVFIDYGLGTRVLFPNDGLLHVDQVSTIRLIEDENTPKTFELSIGDDTEMEAPSARVARTAQEFWAGVATLFGQGSMF